MATLKDLIVTGPARILNSVYAASFIKVNGTSAQFLKADGSVDSNVYITSAALPTVNNAVLTVSGSGLNISSASTFTANASVDQTIVITHPTRSEGATSSNVTLDLTSASAASRKLSVVTYTFDSHGHETATSTDVITFSQITDTKVTQVVTSSANTSWRPLIIGATYSDAATFAPSTITSSAYATHLAKYKPNTGVLAIVGLNKMGTNGTVTEGASNQVWNTSGSITTLATVATTGSYSDLSGLPTITDENVKRTLTTGNNEYPVIFSSTTDTSTSPTETARYSANLKATGEGDVVFTKSSTKCRLQYDNTNLCLNFMFE